MRRHAVVGIGVAFALVGAGARFAQPRVEAVAVTASLPRYHGALHGPAGRVRPDGKSAAAYWWSVGSEGEDGHLYCDGKARDQLRLDDLPIEWSAASGDQIGLVSHDRADEHGLRFMFDLGAIEDETSDTVPPGTCAGDDARFLVVSIPEGAHVEVAGCLRNDHVVACEADTAGVIAVGGLDDYFARAREAALQSFRYAIAVAAVLLGACGYLVIDRLRRAGRFA